MRGLLKLINQKVGENLTLSLRCYSKRLVFGLKNVWMVELDINQMNHEYICNKFQPKLR